MGLSPYRGPVDRCVACGAELGVGRFCLNCGHPVGAPAPEVVEHRPIAPPVQAADPTPVAPTNPTAPAPEPESEAAPSPLPAPEPAPRSPRPAPVVPPAPRHEWDPEEDLLPYEEVDDLDEAPIRGQAWILWVVGAVLLIGLAFLLLRVLGTDGAEVDAEASAPTSSESSDAPADADQAAADTASEVPEGVGPLVQLVEGATFAVASTAPPTRDLDGTLVAYDAAQMGDGDPATTWRTPGAAELQEIRVTLPQEAVVTRVGLINGYAKKVAGVDWYPNNRRILSVTWAFDDGSWVEQTFAERPGMQRLKVPPVRTGTVVITINTVTPPGPGSLGRDYTAVSEISVVGRRAG